VEPENVSKPFIVKTGLSESFVKGKKTSHCKGSYFKQQAFI
jgi:hypothetical protein